MSYYCPTCGGPITREKLAEITKTREDDQIKKAAAEAALKTRLEQQYQQGLEVAKKQANEEAEKRVAQIRAERDSSLAKVKQLQVAEAALRKQSQDEAARMRKALQDKADTELHKQLNEQRRLLERDRDERLLKQRAEANRATEAFLKKIKDLERQLQQKTSNEIGDGAEIDLFEALREAFPEDNISRIPKGQPGADILHKVIHKGEVCGSIVVDSKNRKAWQRAFVTKLREDRVKAGAEHAILATAVFPSGKKELCIESDVVVVSPGRVVPIVTLLRQAMIQMHVRGLSVKQRASKMDDLYSYITSEAYDQHSSEATRLTAEILELDVDEKKAHDTVWKKRGSLATRLNNVLREIDTHISAIVERSSPLPVSAPYERAPMEKANRSSGSSKTEGNLWQKR